MTPSRHRLSDQAKRLRLWVHLLASINVIALRQTRLVPGSVTHPGTNRVCGRVKHLGM